ncbi:MAG: coproporphyrinogen III oxidase, partial [Myxococcota bacterium]
MARDVFSLDLARVEAILPRYAIEGPRYTSYPTAPVWKESFGVEQFKTELASGSAEANSVAGEGDGLSLYVHIPFCRSLCHFCACNKIITSKAELPLRFLDTIER